MAGASVRKPWEEAFRRVRGVYWPDRIYLPLTSAADLDAAEAELGFRFPVSYRAFAQEFGLGGVLHGLPELLPLARYPWREKDDWPRSVLEWSRADRATTLIEVSDDLLDGAELLTRLVIFAVDGGYHTFGFDPSDTTDRQLNEYRIYDVGRDGEPYPVAGSFTAWLAWVEQQYRLTDGEEEVHWEENYESAPLIAFKPDSEHRLAMLYEREASPQRKQAPDEASVRLWLAWNGGTIAGIVRSIRDGGQSDAFPVLADALEDAGCDNTDLLDSCRRGDPDIDGVWVVRVLSLDEERKP